MAVLWPLRSVPKPSGLLRGCNFSDASFFGPNAVVKPRMKKMKHCIWSSLSPVIKMKRVKMKKMKKEKINEVVWDLEYLCMRRSMQSKTNVYYLGMFGWRCLGTCIDRAVLCSRFIACIKSLFPYTAFAYRGFVELHCILHTRNTIYIYVYMLFFIFIMYL